jgi:YHS domain-containing protein
VQGSWGICLQEPCRIINSKIVVMRFILIFCLFVAGCRQNPKVEMNSAVIPGTDTLKKKFTSDMVDNKKDPSCGMPVTAGIEDTVHYNGKVYGFCSDECKQQFLKNPVALAKAAELK